MNNLDWISIGKEIAVLVSCSNLHHFKLFNLLLLKMLMLGNHCFSTRRETKGVYITHFSIIPLGIQSSTYRFVYSKDSFVGICYH